MGFEIPLEGNRTIMFYKCCVRFQFPWLALIRMDALASIVLIDSPFDIIGNANVPMLSILGFEGIDEVHCGGALHRRMHSGPLYQPGFVLATLELRRGIRLLAYMRNHGVVSTA